MTADAAETGRKSENQRDSVVLQVAPPKTINNPEMNINQAKAVNINDHSIAGSAIYADHQDGHAVREILPAHHGHRSIGPPGGRSGGGFVGRSNPRITGLKAKVGPGLRHRRSRLAG